MTAPVSPPAAEPRLVDAADVDAVASSADHGGWRVIAATCVGGGHVARGRPCDDAHVIAGRDERVVIVVADGAGSARLARQGAEVAASTAARLLVDAEQPAEATVAVAIGAARGALEALARAEGCPLGDLATTIHVAVLSGDVLLTGQIGDGAVVARRSGEALRALDAADRGEYLNETVFLTSSAWVDDARFGIHDVAALDALAVMTDGLQLLAFDMAADTPHPGFFAPLWSWASSVDGEAAETELCAFLSSDRVRARTDDDVTLALVVRS